MTVDYTRTPDVAVRDLPLLWGESVTFDRLFGGALAKPQECPVGSGNVQIGTAGPIIYYGWSVSVAIGATNIPLLRHGTSTSGTAIDGVPASTAIGTKSVATTGLYLASGLFLDWNSQATGTIVVWYWQT